MIKSVATCIVRLAKYKTVYLGVATVAYGVAKVVNGEPFDSEAQTIWTGLLLIVGRDAMGKFVDVFVAALKK